MFVALGALGVLELHLVFFEFSPFKLGSFANNRFILQARKSVAPKDMSEYHPGLILYSTNRVAFNHLNSLDLFLTVRFVEDGLALLRRNYGVRFALILHKHGGAPMLFVPPHEQLRNAALNDFVEEVFQFDLACRQFASLVVTVQDPSLVVHN